MIFLVFSIIASSLLFIVFKLFKKYNINTFQAIVVNYIVASTMGLLFYRGSINISSIVNSTWLVGAIILGFLFIFVFQVMGLTAQRNGLSVASVAGKMSVIFPVVFGIIMYHESVGIQKVIGILIALVAVYLVSVKPKSRNNLSRGLLLPFLLFIGSGIVDTFLKYMEANHLSQESIPLFSASLFCFAGLIGTIILIFKSFKEKFKCHIKTVLGGIVLGIVNYFSLFYLIKALQYNGLESSTLFTINNVAIVMVSSLVGLLLFKESISNKNWIGIGLAVVSILLVTMT